MQNKIRTTLSGASVQKSVNRHANFLVGVQLQSVWWMTSKLAFQTLMDPTVALINVFQCQSKAFVWFWAILACLRSLCQLVWDSVSECYGFISSLSFRLFVCLWLFKISFLIYFCAFFYYSYFITKAWTEVIFNCLISDSAVQWSSLSYSSSFPSDLLVFNCCWFPHFSSIPMVTTVRSSWSTSQCEAKVLSASTPGKPANRVILFTFWLWIQL